MQIEIREATDSDCYDLWLWRNHPDIRKRCFDNSEIDYEEHRKWFGRKMISEDTKIYIAENENKEKIGQARFETNDGTGACININMNPDFLGQGLGSMVIKMATDSFLEKHKRVSKVTAEVIDTNIASQKAFDKAGYKLYSAIDKRNRKVKIFAYSRKDTGTRH